jgi:hypothetical protein
MWATFPGLNSELPRDDVDLLEGLGVGTWSRGGEAAAGLCRYAAWSIPHQEPAVAAIPAARAGLIPVNISSSVRLGLTCACVSLFGGWGILTAQAPKEPETVVLRGSPLGGVKFTHKAHAKDYAGNKCETCHHESKPEKPMKVQHEKCTDCHTKVAAAPMKTKTQAAFHDPMGKKGTCIDCHQQAAGTAKKAPTKCADCHKKDNA